MSLVGCETGSGSSFIDCISRREKKEGQLWTCVPFILKKQEPGPEAPGRILKMLCPVPQVLSYHINRFCDFKGNNRGNQFYQRLVDINKS